MEAERWQRIEQLYHSAQSLTAEARQKFLQDVCSGDETLCREVESLLRHGDRTGSILESPALAVVAQQLARDRNEEQLLREGTIISHYRIREAVYKRTTPWLRDGTVLFFSGLLSALGLVAGEIRHP